MRLHNKLPQYYDRCNSNLAALLATNIITPTSLREAIAYVTLNGGKRIRPLLVYTTGTGFRASLACLDIPACAVELVHTYSLVHDDLPAMDNAALRHGKPSCHKAFGEATAILCGDALQVLALQILTDTNKSSLAPHQSLQMITVLTEACGIAGMVGGQALDMEMNQHPVTVADLDLMYTKKTGALISASVQLGAIAAGVVDARELEKLNEFAKFLGLAYQIQDDILDLEASTEILGKPQGIDKDNAKITYPTLIGMEAAKRRVRELFDMALTALSCFDKKTETLIDLAKMLLERKM